MSGEPPAPPGSNEEPAGNGSVPPEHSLSMPMRIALLIFGWLLILLGIAGLALPGLQGILTLIAGAAVLSVASDSVHQVLRRLLHRWPKLERRFNHLRDIVHDKFTRH